MPELPEVQTTVNGLNTYTRGFTITDVWTDLSVKNPISQFVGTFKDAHFFETTKKKLIDSKIMSAERKAKNILIHLSTKQTLLIHMKMTGHLMFGTYTYNSNTNAWSVSPTEKNHALRDPYNRFIHVVFTLKKGTTIKHLVLCDSRKFAKVTVLKDQADHTKHLDTLGPEPLSEEFTLPHFIERLNTKPKSVIKTVLMTPQIISGIGNIYSDEMLWMSGIHPERKIQNLTHRELKLLFASMKKVLIQGIDFGGDSTSDYRNILGEKGAFHGTHNVYRETHKPCRKKNCTGVIHRKIVHGRSAHFCSVHQK